MDTTIYHTQCACLIRMRQAHFFERSIRMTLTKPTAERPAGLSVASGKGPRKFPKVKKRWLLLAALLAAAALAAFLSSRGRAPQGGGLTYTQAEVSSRTITKSLSGSGTLQPANSYTVTTLAEGDILSADFEEGDMVEKDMVLYQIDSSDASNNIEKAQISLEQAQRSYDKSMDKQYVRAKTSGQVYSLEVEVGDEVSQGQTVATIRDSSVMQLTVPFPADDAETFYAGQAASVTLDGSFETLSGTVKSVSGSEIIGTGNMVTRSVTISVANPGAISAEQTASASIGGIQGAGSASFTYNSQSTLTAQASGTVVSISVPEGGSIEKNQILLTLGGSDMNDTLQNAQDSLRNAQLSMESTQKQLDNYTITSPISGTIVDKQYKTGDTVESGRTLCTIYDLSYLEMTLNIDELDISSVSVGQTVQITADAVENGSYQGVITKVSVAGTTSGGITSYPVTIRIDETEGLLPGMNVDAEIVIASAEDTLAIPNGAVSRGSLVLVTEDSPSAANAVEQEAPEGYVYVQVETGVSDDDYIQIISGLQQGDTVGYLALAGSSSSDMMGMMGGMPGGMSSGMPSGGMPGGGGGMPSGGGHSGGGGGGGFR